MGQIIFNGQKPKYCNLYAITSGSKVNFIPAKGEVWLVDTSVATAADVANDTKVNGVGYYDAYITGDGIKTCAQLVATALKKVDEYQKPVAGIPKTDLANDVQTSLGKADSALQSHQDISGKADKSEMSVVAGTGANADKTTITLKSGTSATVLISHQDISGKADKSNTYTKTEVDEAIAGTGSGIETVTVAVDNNTGTPSGTASISGSTLSLNFSNLKGAKGDPGATGAQGPQGLQGIQGPEGPRGNDGNTSDSPIVIIHQVDKDTEYEPTTDVVGPDVIQNLSADDINLPNQGLVKPTVGGAFTELINGKVTIDVTGGTLKRAKIGGSTWNVNGSYYCGLVPISDYIGKEITIVANSDNTCYYAFMTSDTIGSHSSGVTTFATGYTAVKTITKGNSAVETVPSDATHLYLQRANANSSTDISLLPSSVFIESALRLTSSIVEYSKGNTETTVKESLDDLYDTKDEYENGGILLDINSGTNEQKEFASSVWSTSSAYSIFYDISQYVGKEITITANSEQICYYAFLTDISSGNNANPVTNYVDGVENTRVPAGESDTYIIPNNAAYLCVRKGSNNDLQDTQNLPASVVIDGNAVDITTGTLKAAYISWPSWTTGGNRRCSILPLPYAGRKIAITANDNYTASYAYLTDGISGSNQTAVTNLAKHTVKRVVAAGKTKVEVIPSDATHLYVYRAATSSATDLTYAPKSIFVRSAISLEADAVKYSDDYYEESNVQTVLETLNKDVNGIEVYDISKLEKKRVFTDSNSIANIENNLNYFYKEIALYTGETVTIKYNSAPSESGTVAIAQWLDGTYKPLFYYSGNTSTELSYTATQNMIVLCCMIKSVKSLTVTRNSKRIDSLEKTETSFTNNYNINKYLGRSYTPEYTTVGNSRIKYNVSTSTLYVESADSRFCYTSPIFVKTGETITVINYNSYSSPQVLSLSDENGTLISPISVAVEYENIGNKVYNYRATEDCYIVVSTYTQHTILITPNSKVQDYMDAYDKYTAGTSILDFYANRETENMLRQLTWGYNSNLNLGLTQHKPLCLLHFSDIHNNNVGEHGANEDGVSNSNRIVAFFNKYKKNGSSGFIDDAIHTGDAVYATAGGNFPWTQNEDIAKVLNVMGNHDLDGTSDWPYLYNKFFAPYVEGWGVTVPDDAATDGKCYYYKDYTTNNVRLIVLMDWMWLGSNSLTESYHSAQNTWFQSVLADARTQGLTVVCAAHVTPQKLNLLEGCTFNSWECAEHGDAGPTTANRYADSVDAFIQAGGDFACWIGGHTHFDLIGTLQSYPDQFCILVENASCWSYYDTDHRITGTLSQDCFNVMSIDTTLKRVNVMRIGSNFASAMQHKGAFSYDYKQKKLLNCW